MWPPPGRRSRRATSERGLTSVVGNVLLVTIVIVLAVTVTVFAFAYAEEMPGGSAEASFALEESPAGLELTPRALTHDVDVLLNDEHVASIDADEAGVTTLLPTSRGDRVLVVSRDGDSSVLLREAVDDRSEAGDFIAHYTFDAQSGSTLIDRSGNGNDGTVEGDPTWINDGTGTGLGFDGSDDHVTITDLGVDAVSVEEFTVAVTYRQDGGTDRVNQLVEHHFDGNEWFLETADAGSGAYDVDYAVNWPTDQVSTSQGYTTGETHVAVATYDGSDYELFVDGTSVGSDTYADSVEMGDMVLAADAPDGGSQHLDGTIYEVRLYYTAFDSDEVETITTVMD